MGGLSEHSLVFLGCLMYQSPYTYLALGIVKSIEPYSYQEGVAFSSCLDHDVFTIYALITCGSTLAF